jgi:hypothetical protein
MRCVELHGSLEWRWLINGRLQCSVSVFEKPRNQNRRGMMLAGGLAATGMEQATQPTTHSAVCCRCLRPLRGPDRMVRRPKNLPCTPDGCSLCRGFFAPQLWTRPADSCLPRCWIPFSSPLDCRRPEFPYFFFSFIHFICRNPRLPCGVRAVVLPLFRPIWFGVV